MEEKINNPHDKGFKDILSNKEIFLELLQSFVHESWVYEVEVQNLEIINNTFILADYTEKEADVIYKLKLKDREIIFFCLLELQSTVDYTMPIRLLFYMTSIWMEYLKNIKKKDYEIKDFRLPVIIPMVLYNGEGAWTVSTSFKEYLDVHEHFNENILDFKYILFDVNKYCTEELLALNNFIASIFVLDKKQDPDKLIENLRNSSQILKGLSPEKIKLFKRWLRYIFRSRLPKETSDEVDKILD